MNRNGIESLMYNYCLDKLSLRDEKIDNEYDPKLNCLGTAQAKWSSKGKLIGDLKIKIKRVRDLQKTLDTIAHELTHIRQYVDGTAYFKGDNRFYAGVQDHYNYAERSVERDARRRAKVLTRNFIDRHWEDMSLWSKFNIMYFNLMR